MDLIRIAEGRSFGVSVNNQLLFLRRSGQLSAVPVFHFITYGHLRVFRVDNTYKWSNVRISELVSVALLFSGSLKYLPVLFGN